VGDPQDRTLGGTSFYNKRHYSYSCVSGQRDQLLSRCNVKYRLANRLYSESRKPWSDLSRHWGDSTLVRVLTIVRNHLVTSLAALAVFPTMIGCAQSEKEMFVKPSAESLRAQIYEDERQNQEAIRDCMVSAGFDYTAADPRLTRSVSPIPVYDASPGTLEWYALYGLGVTTLAFDKSMLPDDLQGSMFDQPAESTVFDPNVATYRALSDSERTAWDSQLEECTTAVRMADVEARQVVGRASGERLQAIEEAVRSDSRVVSIYQEVAACVQAAGFDMGSDIRPDQFLLKRYGSLLELATLGNPLSTGEIDQVREAQKYELEFAAALRDCGYFTTVQRTIQSVVAEYEASY
jgi:hypothetical protein